MTQADFNENAKAVQICCATDFGMGYGKIMLVSRGQGWIDCITVTNAAATERVHLNFVHQSKRLVTIVRSLYFAERNGFDKVNQIEFDEMTGQPEQATFYDFDGTRHGNLHLNYETAEPDAIHSKQAEKYPALIDRESFLPCILQRLFYDETTDFATLQQMKDLLVANISPSPHLPVVQPKF